MSKQAMSDALSSKEAMRKAAKEPKKLRSVEIEHAKNGGHIIRHRYENNGPVYHEADEYVFGESEGKKMAAHLSKHMGVKMAADKDKDGE